MRLWINLLTVTLLLFSMTGCSSFRQIGKSNNSILGLKKRQTSARADLSDEIMDPLGARNTNRILLDDLAPSQIASTIKARGFFGADDQAANEYFAAGKRQYAEAIQLMESNPSAAYQEKFLDAANSFRVAGSRAPDSNLEEEAAYFEGESFFFADHYVQSNRAFEKLIANYSGTKYLDLAEKRRFSIALYWIELSENYNGPSLTDAKRPKTNPAAEARRVLHRIRIDDPTGKLADDATLALGKAFLKDDRYYEAADAFEDLRQNYPGSKHQFTAHMLELEAHLRGYQGASYDDTPLRKADKLMKQIVRQFPNESSEQLEYLEQQAGSIKTQLAQRDYSLGEYFERRGENRAAKYVYEQVEEKFQGTEFASSVAEQIAKVEKLPPVPKQHAKWLVDMFPNDEDEKPLIASGENTVFR